jgi:hypothetical protein
MKILMPLKFIRAILKKKKEYVVNGVSSKIEKGENEN